VCCRNPAVDTLSIRTHAVAPDLRMVDTLFLGCWAAPSKLIVLTVLADCAGARRAPLFDSVDFGPISAQMAPSPGPTD